MGGIIPQDVPLEGFAKQRDRDARPAKIHHRQAAERRRQNCSSRYLNTVTRLDTITNSPPSRTHLAAAGCFAAKLFHSCINSPSLSSAVAQALFQLCVQYQVFTASMITRTRPMIQNPCNSITMPSTMPMLMAPLVILARARSGMLYWNSTFRSGLPRL